jgi:hypothetical protein
VYKIKEKISITDPADPKLTFADKSSWSIQKKSCRKPTAFLYIASGY